MKHKGVKLVFLYLLIVLAAAVASAILSHLEPVKPDPPSYLPEQ